MPAEEVLDRPLVFPIGHYCGATLTEEKERQHEVRHGPQIVTLTDPMFAVWSLAHGVPDAPEGETWGTAQILQRAAEADVDAAGTVLDQLLAADLCVRVRSGTPPAREFARTYQLHPTMLGLGNSPDDPDLYGIGFIGSPVLRVSRGVFEVWRWAPLGSTLLASCEQFAEREREAGITDLDVIDVDRVLAGVLDSLHALLTAGAGYLDLAR